MICKYAVGLWRAISCFFFLSKEFDKTDGLTLYLFGEGYYPFPMYISRYF